MKKKLYSIVAILSTALLATSCGSDLSGSEANNNENNAGEIVQMTFTASQEGSDVQTRTAINSSGQIVWSSGDALAIWDGTRTNAFTVTPNASDATTSTITGGVTAGSTKFTAVYPYSVGKSCDFSEANTIKGVVIPQTQTATADSYDPATAIMTAYSTNSSFTFKNICTFLKITTTEAYKSIEVSVATGNIAGTFSVNPTTGAASATDGKQTITLNPATSGSTIAAGTYYVAIAPGSVTNLTIKCIKNDDGDYTTRTASSFNFVRNGSYNLGSTGDSGWKTVKAVKAVGLGLSVDWAEMNVGANSAEEYGYYFAWGETTAYNQVPNAYPSTASMDWTTTSTNSGYSNLVTGNTAKTDYSWSTYKWGTAGSASSQLKYKSSSYTTLEAADDAASVNMGGTWRMPTQAEWAELYNSYYTYWQWTTNYNGKGVKGYIVYKKKTSATYSVASDAHIFLPAAGRRSSSKLDGASTYGYYWSSSLYASNTNNAYGMYFSSGSHGDSNLRYYGFSVRAVRPKN